MRPRFSVIELAKVIREAKIIERFDWERWLSGRKRRFAKSVTGKLVRRFESCPLRLLKWQILAPRRM